MSACHAINHRTTHVIVSSCSCMNIHTHTHTHTHQPTHTHTQTHTHTHERTRTWIAVFAFSLLKTEGPSPLPTFTPSSLKMKREGGHGGSRYDERECRMDLGASLHRGGESIFFSPSFFLTCPAHTLQDLGLLCCCSALYSLAPSQTPGASLLLLCPRQTPCAQPPLLLRCSPRPAPRTLTEAHTRQA